MKRTIFLGCVVTFFLLLMIPSIHAVEYDVLGMNPGTDLNSMYQTTSINKFGKKIENLDIKALIDDLQNQNNPPSLIGLLIKLLAFFGQIISYFSIFNIIPTIISFIIYLYLLIFWN